MTSVFHLFSIGLLGLFLSATSVQAQESAKKIDDAELNIIDKEWKPNQSSEAIKKNAFLKTLLDGGVELVPLGNEAGFDGWLAHKDDEVQIFYTIPGSEAVLTGSLISKDGENLTAFQLTRYETISGNALAKKVEAARKAKDSLPESEKFYREVETALWFGYGGTEEGSTKVKDIPYMYVFMTPECKDCKTYLNDLVEKYAKNNVLQVRSIPVSANDKQKETVKKAISQTEAAKSWMFTVMGISDAQFEKTEASAGSAAFVEGNNEILAKRKLSTYPLTVYKNTKGEVKIIKGIPKNLDDVAVDLTVK